MIQSPDTGFLLAGQTDSDGDSGTAWLVKVDREGNTQWRKRYQTNTSSWLRSVVASTKGGDFLVQVHQRQRVCRTGS